MIPGKDGFRTLLLLLSIGFLEAAPDQKEVDALIDLYNSTNGPGWTRSDGWLMDPDACKWFGISCGLRGDENVAKVNLAGNSLRGSLPESLDSLTQLQVLDLLSNELEGTIPSLANLPLKELHLNHNSLSGTIPDSITTHTSLTSLNLNANSLTGTIPPLLTQLPNLVHLALYSNSLTGPLPPLITCPLHVLHFHENSLYGTIPPSVTTIASLRDLNFASNSITGTIPDSLSSLTSLESFDVSSNSLTGPIPPSLNTLSQLSLLSLAKNSLEGTIPPLGNLQQVTILKLNNNAITGTLPNAIGELGNSNLTQLDASYNMMEGLIPPSVCSVQNFSLSGNKFCGPVPSCCAVKTCGEVNPCPEKKKHSSAWVWWVILPLCAAGLAFVLVWQFTLSQTFNKEGEREDESLIPSPSSSSDTP